MTVKLFISYRSLDSAKVDALVARLSSLKGADYRIWQDKTSIPVGQDWWEAIVDAIIECDIFIFMVSREAVRNINCRVELSYAQKRNRPILPLVLEGEFFFNPVSGKHDIDYWQDIPEELNDFRAQFLFYEETSFVKRLEDAIAHFEREPQRWRDIPADRPPDPRLATDETNNTTVLYDEACDYAWRLEIATAERLFQKLVRMNDPDFGDDAHEWILLLRDYQKLLTFDARDSTRHKVQTNWSSYKQHFPKPFVALFDPKGLQARFEKAGVVSKPSAAVITLPKPDIKTILPAPFDWIEIPAGKITIANTWDNDKDVFLKRGKARTYKVPVFYIAKYPVTNAQYAKFIEAGGYNSNNKKWWTNEGWQQKKQGSWKEPRYWYDNQWNGDLQPVVGVSWYEAMAFCNWLNDVVGWAFMMKFSLPTEPQWQRAARGDDGRRYPWGNDWDSSRCNNNVDRKGIGKTTPVTQYQGRDSGNSYFGVVDMAGNIYEWCKTIYHSGSNDINGAGMRVCRGGSWDDDFIDMFLCVVRGGSPPDIGDNNIGFRVALSYP